MIIKRLLLFFAHYLKSITVCVNYYQPHLKVHYKGLQIAVLLLFVNRKQKSKLKIKTCNIAESILKKHLKL